MAEQWHPSTISESSTVLRFSEGFSPNPPEFCKLPDTDAGKGGKAGGIGGVTDPNPHPVVLEEVVVAQWVASAQTVQQYVTQLVRVQIYSHLVQEPFGIQPHHEIWAFQALGDPLQKRMNFVKHKTLFQSHVFQPLALWHLSPYSTNLDETCLQLPSNNAIGTTQLDPFQHQHFPFVPHELFEVLRSLNPAANPRHSRRTQARKLLGQLRFAPGGIHNIPHLFWNHNNIFGALRPVTYVKPSQTSEPFTLEPWGSVSQTPEPFTVGPCDTFWQTPEPFTLELYDTFWTTPEPLTLEPCDTSLARLWASMATCFLGSILPDPELHPFPLPVPSLGLCLFTFPRTGSVVDPTPSFGIPRLLLRHNNPFDTRCFSDLLLHLEVFSTFWLTH